MSPFVPFLLFHAEEFQRREVVGETEGRGGGDPRVTSYICYSIMCSLAEQVSAITDELAAAGTDQTN